VESDATLFGCLAPRVEYEEEGFGGGDGSPSGCFPWGGWICAGTLRDGWEGSVAVG